MRETIYDTIYDDEFSPVEMTISEGFYKDVPTTHYSIQLEAGFDDDIDDMLLDLDLDTSGYVLESIIHKFLEAEKPELLETITGNDCESSTFVIYADTEDNQRLLAKEIQRLCNDFKLFKKITKKNIKFIRDNSGDSDNDD